VRYMEVLYIANILAESQMDNFFFHFDLQKRELYFRAEKRNTSIDSLLFVLVSTSSIVNLFTSSWDALVISHFSQNLSFLQLL